MTIIEVGEDNVQLYRDVRIDALTIDPDAFASRLEREAAFDDATWKARVTSFAGRPGAVFVDVPNGHHDPIGVVGVGLENDQTDSQLWGMWVRPAARGLGVGEQLIKACRTWATAHGATTMTLWVAGRNGPAMRLYERSGFAEIDAIGMTPPPYCVEPVVMRTKL